MSELHDLREVIRLQERILAEEVLLDSLGRVRVMSSLKGGLLLEKDFEHAEGRVQAPPHLKLKPLRIGYHLIQLFKYLLALSLPTAASSRPTSACAGAKVAADASRRLLNTVLLIPGADHREELAHRLLVVPLVHDLLELAKVL